MVMLDVPLAGLDVAVVVKRANPEPDRDREMCSRRFALLQGFKAIDQFLDAHDFIVDNEISGVLPIRAVQPPPTASQNSRSRPCG